MGTTDVQRDNVGERLAQAPLLEPQCEVLFEIFDGNAGRVQLGRMLKGHDAGRLVALRTLRDKPSDELASATDVARSIAHPKLAKVLGTVQDEDAWYVASEYISGVTLFELGEVVTSRCAPLNAAVAVRIILDALQAADEARHLLVDTASLHGVRCVYPESIWIAEFGEVFVSEVFIAPILARTTSPFVAEDSGAAAGPADVRAAAVELIRLLSGGATDEDPLDPDMPKLPTELSDVLVHAVGRNGADRYGSLQEFIGALTGLDNALIATEEQVSQEMQRLVGSVLERRRQKLEMLERFSSPTGNADETRCFRAAVVTGEQRDTARPPPAPAEERSSKRPLRERSEPPDALTTVFRSRAPQRDSAPAQSGEADAEASTSTISGVWREARALHGSPGRSTRPNILSIPAKRSRPAPGDERAAVSVAPNAKDAIVTTASVIATKRSKKRRIVLLLVALSLAAGIGAVWVHYAETSETHAWPVIGIAR